LRCRPMNLDEIKRTYFRFRGYYQRVKAHLDFSTRAERKKFGALRIAYYRKYWDRVAIDYGADIEDVGHNILRISKSGRHTFVRGYEVMLDNHLSLNMMGNKPLTHQLLKQGNYPVPRHLNFTLKTIEGAYDFQNEIGKLVVVKPAGGGSGRGGTTKISDARQLKKAARSAVIFHSELLIEEQVEGASYRLLYLGGRLIDIVRRDAPRITGDGVSSVRTLIEKENVRRLESADVYALSPIVIDIGCKAKLREQSLGLNDTLDAGQVVIVKNVINQNTVLENHVIAESEVHPSTIAMGSDIAGDFGLELIGLDVISEDISMPLSQNGGVINEVNTTPGLHHHDLVANKESRAEVAAQILDYIFSKQASIDTPGYESPRSVGQRH